MEVAVAVMQIVMTPIIAPIVTAVKAAAAQTIVQDIIIILTGPAPTDFVWAPHLNTAQTAVTTMVVYDYINIDL